MSLVQKINKILYLLDVQSGDATNTLLCRAASGQVNQMTFEDVIAIIQSGMTGQNLQQVTTTGATTSVLMNANGGVNSTALDGFISKFRPDRFSIYDGGPSNKYFSVFDTFAGVENFEIYNYREDGLGGVIYYDVYSSNDGSVTFAVGLSESPEYNQRNCSFSITPDGVLIQSNVSTSPGLSANMNFSANLTDYAYPQKIYTDTKIAKDVGPTYTTNAIKTLTQAEYDALVISPGVDNSTLYFII